MRWELSGPVVYESDCMPTVKPGPLLALAASGILKSTFLDGFVQGAARQVVCVGEQKTTCPILLPSVGAVYSIT